MFFFLGILEGEEAGDGGVPRPLGGGEVRPPHEPRQEDHRLRT